MMQKLWQKKLKLNYSAGVFDIVQFGSSVIEGKEARDIDIAVIFDRISIKGQLNEAQEIKKQLKRFTGLEIHVSSFDLYSLFDKSNFSREGIIFYGKSLLSGDYFSERFGLKSLVQIRYSLQKLKKKGKVQFHYMLQGKKGKYGLLRKYNGALIGPGIIEIAPEYEEIFVKAVKETISDFSVSKILAGKT